MGCWLRRETFPVSPSRTFGTEHAGSPARDRSACRRREDRGPIVTCGRRRFQRLYRKLRRLFFLPPSESDDSGFGVAKDTGHPLLRGKRSKEISIGKSPLFSHARFISNLSMLLQVDYPLLEPH